MKNSRERLLWFFVIVRLILPYWLQDNMYEPHRDEFLYLAEGNHLDWGFMEVPPMLSVFAWLTHVLGDGIFWIKLWPSLFGAATFYVMGKLILSLGGGRFALWLLFLSFMLTAYLRVFFLFQPNAPEIFFWTMIVFSMIRYIQTTQNKWLYMFGASAALGMLSKYSVLFYIVSVSGGLLFTPYRKLFLNKHFWFASLLAVILFLPNFIWQYQHHFPVIYHMNELQETQLQYISPLDFLNGQVKMFFPVVFVWICGLYNVFFSRSEQRFRFVGWAYVFVIILLIAGHGKDYYALGSYPVLLAFGSFFLEKFTAVKRKALRYVFVAVPLLLGAILIPVLLPVSSPEKLVSFYKKTGIDKSGALRWEDLKNHPLPQDFSDMLGWEEMAKKVATAYHSLSPEQQKNTLIFCNNYGMAGAVNYYGKKYNLPDAYSDNASFLYWLPSSASFQNLVLVTSNKNELQQDYVKYFTSAYIADSVTNKYAREYGDFIVVETGDDKRFQKFFKDKLAKDKAKLMREK